MGHMMLISINKSQTQRSSLQGQEGVSLPKDLIHFCLASPRSLTLYLLIPTHVGEAIY